MNNAATVITGGSGGLLQFIMLYIYLIRQMVIIQPYMVTILDK